uniref:Putative secreted peptide n=1 Tax=Anopheles braziliensis TaxID=58242 RepID=A0A2M3ZQU4_9DIPT
MNPSGRLCRAMKFVFMLTVGALGCCGCLCFFPTASLFTFSTQFWIHPENVLNYASIFLIGTRFHKSLYAIKHSKARLCIVRLYLL